METIRIYYTSDIHGNVFPVDYSGIGRKKGGLLPIAREIVKDPNTLVLDGGDSLQGTPLIAYYLEHRREFKSHPIAEAFAAMGLDAFTLGNHDFNFGYEAIRDYVLALKGHGAVCVCANVSDLWKEIPLERWHLFVLENGLRVGVTGVVTDYVHVWEKPENLQKFELTDSLTEARRALLEMGEAGCDLTVCIYHGGYERDLATGELLSESLENRACLLGQELSYDLLLTGHQHMSIEGVSFGETFSCQPPDNAVRYIYLEGSREDQAAGFHFQARLVDAGERYDGRGFEELKKLEEKTQVWLYEPIGHFEKPLPARDKLDAALHGSELADLINRVQLDLVPADFSCTSLRNEPVGLGEEVSIRDVYTVCPFANVCVLKQVTGQTLRQALERCASYFDLKEGRPVVSERFLHPKVEHYNYDFYAGLDYAFDIRKPLGERVVRLRKLDGSPIIEEETYTLVCSDYRASGTGGYEMIGRSPVLYTGADSMQDVLIRYIRTHKGISPEKNSAFEVIY